MASGRGVRNPELTALTGLRFFAAMHVVLYHFAGAALPAAAPAAIHHFVAHGFIGVSLFYILSGFILAYNYWPNANPAAALAGKLPVARAKFWWSRFARIYPIYFVAWLLYLPIEVGHRFSVDSGATAWAKLAALATISLGLLQAWIPISWNQPSWSISVEAFFYLLFPWIICRVAATPAESWRKQLGIAYMLALVVPAVYVLIESGRVGETIAVEARGLVSHVKFNPVLHLGEFVCGVVLGRQFLVVTSTGVVTWVERNAAWVVTGSALSIVGLLSFRLEGLYPLLHNGLLIPAFGALIYGLASGQGRFAQLLSTPAMRALGDASYGLYILQTPIWLLGLQAAPSMPLRVRLGLFLVLLPVLSLLAHRFIETPARDRLKRAWAGYEARGR